MRLDEWLPHMDVEGEEA